MRPDTRKGAPEGAHAVAGTANFRQRIARRTTVEHIVRPLLDRVTPESYALHGPITAAEIDLAAGQLRWTAASLHLRGYELAADAAVALADRLDETAELARLIDLEHRAA